MDGRVQVKDLDREVSTNQELQIQNLPRLGTPAQPTAGDNIIDTFDAPQTGSPFTVGGPPIFYGTRQREAIAGNTYEASPICTSPINNLNIVTYNCKNAETSKYAIKELSVLADIVLLKEHSIWYFDCQLGNLSAICDSCRNWKSGRHRGPNTACTDAKKARGSDNIAEEND